MINGFLYKKQSCGYFANLEMLIAAEQSNEFNVEFENDLDESSKQAINKGIKLILDRSGLIPHKFIVSNLIEHQKDTPPMGFEMCAQGAARLALGLSNVNASYPWGNSVEEKEFEKNSNEYQNET